MDVAAAAEALLSAERPVIHAGQGCLYAEASAELKELAELLQAPVMTTMQGKSVFTRGPSSRPRFGRDRHDEAVRALHRQRGRDIRSRVQLHRD